MQRHPLIAVLIVLAPVLCSVPASAREGLDCLSEPFSDADQATLNSNLSNLSIERLQTPPNSPELFAVLRGRVAQCRDRFGWEPPATELAARHLHPALLADAILRDMPFSAEVKMDLTRNYAEADSTRLAAAFIAVFGGEIVGVPVRAAEQADHDMIAQVTDVADLPQSFESGAWIGAWLASRLYADVTARQFAELD